MGKYQILGDLTRAAEIVGKGLIADQERKLAKQELLEQYKRDKEKLEFGLATEVKLSRLI